MITGRDDSSMSAVIKKIWTSQYSKIGLFKKAAYPINAEICNIIHIKKRKLWQRIF